MDLKQQKRPGFVGIIVERREQSAQQVQRVLAEHAELMVARVGLPQRDRGCAVITLVVDATTDELGRLTGRLGQIEGVTVKAALSRWHGREATS